MSIAEPPVIQVNLQRYLRMLVKASNTDPADWPDGYERGAALLARIREIERDCVAEHGKWDIDALGEELENEYEDSIAHLEDLIGPYDPNEHRYSHAEVFADVLAHREHEISQ